MVPPAPARFSTITVRPISFPSSAFSDRATMSWTPPAENGTTIWTTGCAAAAAQKASSEPARRAFSSRNMREILPEALSDPLFRRVGDESGGPQEGQEAHRSALERAEHEERRAAQRFDLGR